MKLGETASIDRAETKQVQDCVNNRSLIRVMPGLSNKDKMTVLTQE